MFIFEQQLPLTKDMETMQLLQLSGVLSKKETFSIGHCILAGTFPETSYDKDILQIF